LSEVIAKDGVAAVVQHSFLCPYSSRMAPSKVLYCVHEGTKRDGQLKVWKCTKSYPCSWQPYCHSRL